MFAVSTTKIGVWGWEAGSCEVWEGQSPDWPTHTEGEARTTGSPGRSHGFHSSSIIQVGGGGRGACTPPGNKRHLEFQGSTPWMLFGLPILNEAGTRSGVSKHFKFCGPHESLSQVFNSSVAAQKPLETLDEWAQLCPDKHSFTDTEMWMSYNFYMAWNSLLIFSAV